MFSVSLFLQNGISPRILDKARSLSAFHRSNAALNSRVEWEGVGMAQIQGWLKIRYKGFGLPILLKNRVGMVSEKLKRTTKKGLGTTWFPRVGWEWLGKAKNEA